MDVDAGHSGEDRGGALGGKGEQGGGAFLLGTDADSVADGGALLCVEDRQPSGDTVRSGQGASSRRRRASAQRFSLPTMPVGRSSGRCRR